MAICEVLSVGTEILLGEILDTNGMYLSDRLARMGISVLHRTTVGDNFERLAEAFNTAISRSDIVISTGGLGPTPDDITAQVVCHEFGFELEFNEAVADKIKKYFARKGADMPESNLKQAYVPKGGAVFDNGNGTAPGMGMKKNGKCVVILPGPPYEMSRIFEDSVIEYLEEYRTDTIFSHEIRTIGISESLLAEKCADLFDNKNPTLAPYCKIGEALLRITARAENEEAAEILMAPMLKEIKSRVGEFIYGIDVGAIEETTVPLLMANGLTVATAESCTGGLLAKRITDIPGASKVFKHGVITYANEVKEKVLGVKSETLSKYGAVSRETACEMAHGIRMLSGADIGVSVTGFAGPDADEKGKNPGLIFVALDADGCSLCRKIETGRNDRNYNRTVSASEALNSVRSYITQGGKTGERQ